MKAICSLFLWWILLFANIVKSNFGAPGGGGSARSFLLQTHLALISGPQRMLCFLLTMSQKL